MSPETRLFGLGSGFDLLASPVSGVTKIGASFVTGLAVGLLEFIGVKPDDNGLGELTGSGVTLFLASFGTSLTGVFLDVVRSPTTCVTGFLFVGVELLCDMSSLCGVESFLGVEPLCGVESLCGVEFLGDVGVSGRGELLNGVEPLEFDGEADFVTDTEAEAEAGLGDDCSWDFVLCVLGLFGATFLGLVGLFDIYCLSGISGYHYELGPEDLLIRF